MEAPPLERRLAAILAAGCRGLQPPDAWRRRNDDGQRPPVHDHVARRLAPPAAFGPEVEDVVTLRLDEFFASANALPVADLDQIFGTGGIVVVAPHPDDETLGCGGLIALASQLGRNIQVVVISDGVGSHPNSRSRTNF